MLKAREKESPRENCTDAFGRQMMKDAFEC